MASIGRGIVVDVSCGSVPPGQGRRQVGADVDVTLTTWERLGSMFSSIHGVDFSGARLAGRNTWVARLHPAGRRRLRLTDLDCLEKLAGTAERAPALAHLVRIIAGSDAA